MSEDHQSVLKRAILTIRELERELDVAKEARHEPIAIIGMACRFPGGVNSPEQFWTLLSEGRDAISEIPPDRWNTDRFYSPDPDAEGKATTRWGGFLQELDYFDPGFFGISPREARAMDPQHRLMLEVSYEAFARAGQKLGGLAGSSTGVFIGVHSHSTDYAWRQLSKLPHIDGYAAMGTAHSILTGRLSYFYDLHGPNVAIDTACSSSLVALHLACQSLRNGECGMALVGGVNVILSPHLAVSFSRLRMMSPVGRCKTFDASADGYVRSEGCGALVLKPLRSARQDGEPILAVIRGSAVNQDGHCNGITAPNGRAQSDLIGKALAAARMGPDRISCVEAHGTGTAIGDPIEVEALARALGQTSLTSEPCALASVKTNIGHTEGAAGVAGIIKMCLALRHKMIPPNVHFRRLNPHISLSGTRLYVPTELRAWDVASKTRACGVSAFGWSGTNAHIVLEEAPESETLDVAAHSPFPPVLCVSAKSEAALAGLARAYAAALSDVEGVGAAADLAFTTGSRQTHLDRRIAVVGSLDISCADQWRKSLVALDRSAPASRVFRAPEAWSHPVAPSIVFVFSGQGSQWFGMGQALYEGEPRCRQIFDTCDAAFMRLSGHSLVDLLFSTDRAALKSTAAAQPAIFAVEVALIELLKFWGIAPDAVCGHSLGEVVAAYAAGILDLDESIRVVHHRSRLMQQAHGRGRMLAVKAGAAGIAPFTDGFADRVWIAAMNGPASIVLAGDATALDTLAQRFETERISADFLRVSYAFHTPPMAPYAKELQRCLAPLRSRAARIPIYSTVTGSAARHDEWDSTYWGRNIHEPVRFQPAIEAAIRDGHRLFLEVSPHPVLSRDLTEILAQADVDGCVVPTIQAYQSETEALAETAAQLHTLGIEVDWTAYLGGRRRVVPVPAMVWERQRYWIDREPDATETDAEVVKNVADVASGLYAWSWIETTLRPSETPSADTAWVILATAHGPRAAASLEAAERLRDKLRAQGAPCAIAVLTAEAPNAGPIADMPRGEVAAPAHHDCNLRALVPLLHDLSARLGKGSLHIVATSTLAIDDVEGLGELIELTRILSAERRSPVSALTLMTAGAHTTGADEPPNPWQAAVWGFARCVNLEAPTLSMRVGDLPKQPGSDDFESAFRALAATIFAKGMGEPHWVARGARIFVPRLVRHPWRREIAAAAAEPLELDGDGFCVISGGLGALGLRVASFLVEHGIRDLVLLSRRRDASGVSRELRSLRKLGASIVVESCDVSDAEALSAVLEPHCARRPLRGIIHAAGVLADDFLQRQSFDKAKRVLSPKVLGALELTRFAAGRPLDFFVLFSSLAGVVGSEGQGIYGAANAFLDALAASPSSFHPAIQAIAWGPWADTGMSAELGARERQRLLNFGITPLPPDWALRVLKGVIKCRTSACGAFLVDWSRFVNQATEGTVPSFLAHLARDAVARADDASAPRDDQLTTPADAIPTLVAQLLSCRASEREGCIYDFVRDCVRNALGMDADSPLESSKPLQEYGFDSLIAQRFAKALGRGTGLRFAPTVSFDYPTIQSIVRLLSGELAPHWPDVVPTWAPAEPSVDRSAADIADLLAQELSS